jgi:hypothetical protein
MTETPTLPRPANDDDVGYKKPPKHSQFTKGQSGNPNGRPKGAKNKAPASLKKMNDLVIKEAYRAVTLQDKDGPISLSIFEAALRALGVKAAQGNVQASKVLINLTSKVEAEELMERLEGFDKAVAYKKQKRAEIRACKARGEEPPMMLPHPDDIEINYETGEVIHHGPFNEDDLRIWNRLHGTIATFTEENRELKERLAAHRETEGDGDVVVDDNGDDGEDDDIETFDWIPEEIENNNFFIMTASLSIARRWRLKSSKVRIYCLRMYGSVPVDQFRRHLRDGTDPVPPKAYKEIVAAKRNGEPY